ncbi:MAG: hydroxymethylpyrimidine/phosphomethylpyrimidine kinase [Flavobacteriales bacterium]
MPRNRPYVMVFAGLDPSGGAGLLADIKTIECSKAYGFGVATALTIQDDKKCYNVEWLPIDKILAQAEPLIKKFKPLVIKTGIINGSEMLGAIISFCKKNVPDCRVIVDPVLSASSGYDFVKESTTFKSQLPSCELITPNWTEVKTISGNDNAIVGAKELSKSCAVLLKGGHNESEKGCDYLVRSEKAVAMKPGKGKYFDKHGSGCVLASAIAANLAKGFDLHRACLRGRSYIQQYLSSDVSLLGIHSK